MRIMTKAEIFFEGMKTKKTAFIGVGVSHTALKSFERRLFE